METVNKIHARVNLYNIYVQKNKSILSIPVLNKQKRRMEMDIENEEYSVVFRLMSNENIMSSIEELFGKKSLGWLSKEHLAEIEKTINNTETRNELAYLKVEFSVCEE